MGWTVTDGLLVALSRRDAASEKRGGVPVYGVARAARRNRPSIGVGAPAVRAHTADHPGPPTGEIDARTLRALRVPGRIRARAGPP
ncbi:hypothetical protein Psuf_063940 [Phytohabitans suffuscus]|uniref:Uncharacterized protein n=1 Tax=Phytohabitans suffuscus TaxID=624315 RepID=A0A6F8YTC1_9ACTN|nr:hypothetical protein Psuf_063940 [Phytohabitans suffuscus]